MGADSSAQHAPSSPSSLSVHIASLPPDPHTGVHWCEYNLTHKLTRLPTSQTAMTAVQTPLSPAFPLSELDYPLFPSTSSHCPELTRLHALRNKDAASRCKTPKRIFTLGTRNSKLAMVQTNIVKAALEERWPGIEFRIYGMVGTTSPPRVPRSPLL